MMSKTYIKNPMQGRRKGGGYTLRLDLSLRKYLIKCIKVMLSQFLGVLVVTASSDAATLLSYLFE